MGEILQPVNVRTVPEGANGERSGSSKASGEERRVEKGGHQMPCRLSGILEGGENSWIQETIGGTRRIRKLNLVLRGGKPRRRLRRAQQSMDGSINTKDSLQKEGGPGEIPIGAGEPRRKALLKWSVRGKIEEAQLYKKKGGEPLAEPSMERETTVHEGNGRPGMGPIEEAFSITSIKRRVRAKMRVVRHVSSRRRGKRPQLCGTWGNKDKRVNQTDSSAALWEGRNLGEKQQYQLPAPSVPNRGMELPNLKVVSDGESNYLTRSYI